MADSAETGSIVASAYKPPALLPIAKHRRDLLYTIETFPVTILIGQTGSGKTTQLPQYLEQAGWCNDGKLIAVTQVDKPRRVAATSVATRVAEEMRCNVGQEVGYSIRFEDMTSPVTRIKFMTDGLLLREALVDPLMTRYSIIMVDEAHERSLSTDILLGVLKKIRKKRPELRIIISSATLQADDFLHFFVDGKKTKSSEDQPLGGSEGRIFHLGGRMYPVEYHNLDQPTENYFERALTTVFDIHATEEQGDILVFLTGREEIDRAVQEAVNRSLDLRPQSQKLLPLPLYAGLPTEQQMSVFDAAPENTRKVIFATNIAEASVTIDGIVFVVDCGFVKLRAYNPMTGIEVLRAVPVSKASATQRAGRAGRTKPGKCFRLYTSDTYSSLEDTTIPEVERSNLAPVILQLKALGIDNIVRFSLPTPFPDELLARALELLYSLGVLDDYAKLTKPLGTRMAELSIEPMMAKALLSAPQFDCQSEMLSIAAMTSLQGSIWFSHDGDTKTISSARRDFAAQEGDHLTLLNIYESFITKGKKDASWCHKHNLNFKSMSRAVSIRNQLRRYLERLGVNVAESLSAGALRAGGPDKGEKIRRCLTTGFFAHAARMQPDGTFKTTGGAVLHAHPSSLMFNRTADWVLFQEVMESGEKTFIRDISKIEKAWLLEYAPHFYQIKD